MGLLRVYAKYIVICAYVYIYIYMCVHNHMDIHIIHICVCDVLYVDNKDDKDANYR